MHLKLICSKLNDRNTVSMAKNGGAGAEHNMRARVEAEGKAWLRPKLKKWACTAPSLNFTDFICLFVIPQKNQTPQVVVLWGFKVIICNILTTVEVKFLKTQFARVWLKNVVKLGSKLFDPVLIYGSHMDGFHAWIRLPDGNSLMSSSQLSLRFNTLVLPYHSLNRNQPCTCNTQHWFDNWIIVLEF